jgi:hypothetical protein
MVTKWVLDLSGVAHLPKLIPICRTNTMNIQRVEILPGIASQQTHNVAGSPETDTIYRAFACPNLHA